MQNSLQKYLNSLQEIINTGNAREESFYHCLKELLEQYAALKEIKGCEITIMPKATEAGNPDFCVWDGTAQSTGYIEAKNPTELNLDTIANSKQVQRYLEAFPNLILTNFYEFRLYQHGALIESVMIANPGNALSGTKEPALSNVEGFSALLERYFSFSQPVIKEPRELAKVLAKRTSYMRDEIVSICKEEENRGKRALLMFYDSFKRLLINSMTIEEFADLYAQTITYGIFVARTRSKAEFNRALIYSLIPNTLGILKEIFTFISLETPPKSMVVLIEDIAHILYKTNIQEIMTRFHEEGRGNDPIIYFYETFLSEYDPKLRQSRGVYYTPEPVVRYIVHSINSLLKSHFGLTQGFASDGVTVLDPAAGTLTFPAEAIRVAIEEHISHKGSGDIHGFIQNKILKNFYAIELMMAPYTVGHLKISYLLAEYGYDLKSEERFNLFLSNTLDPDLPEQMELPIIRTINQESILAHKVKQDQQILVIMGNPPYSGSSENKNAWINSLLKEDRYGPQSYYKVDGVPLRERNPKWLQDDYVKFLRFAQWKIHQAEKGIVAMITNHAYLDNPTFRGMRQSLMDTFDEIYILDLHGNVKRQETSPDGNRDDNVFDIQQGTAIVLMIKGIESNKKKVFYHELYGLQEMKYAWLNEKRFAKKTYKRIKPNSPYYLFRPNTKIDEFYEKWMSLPEIFPLNSTVIVTARDKLTIKETKTELRNTIHHFAGLEPETARTVYRLKKDSKEWKILWAQNDLNESGLDDNNIVPILYRPFDIRYTYYTGKGNGFIGRPRKEIMSHMLNENVGIISRRQQLAGQECNYVFISKYIVSDGVIRSDSKGSESFYPLYLYPDSKAPDLISGDQKKYNISQKLFDYYSKIDSGFYGEQIFYYVYAILHSILYRERFAQYLQLNFPRIPFTEDYELFSKLADCGKELADMHLLQSPSLEMLSSRYQGSGESNAVEMVEYDAEREIVKINANKHFDGIKQNVWEYRIGTFQVLHKYLTDRKGKTLIDPIHFCKIATALAGTIELQTKIDELFPKIVE
ncbi:MAG: N-6 DNA methylase [Candidatus Cloacimonetes bacterium]|nr:N-6 DNA methylase [Candidatus Cloacimonadota bacterium]